MHLELRDFTKVFGDLTVIDRMNLTVGDGEMMALLGPSGCGKSTTLFAVCGIHRLNGGQIFFGDRDVSRLPPQSRNVGVVFQNYALYPHMDVRQNIGFPLMVRKESSVDIAREVGEIAELVHITELLDRRPAQLSGGQQQRVALARALVRKPDVLLLDEPLANLDAKLRLEMRSEIRRVQLETGITAILVTHDQVEAMSMCDRIALMRDGRIEQLGKPEQMYKNPANRFVADFLGNPPISFVDVEGRNGGFRLRKSDIPIACEFSGDVATVRSLGIRPEHFGPQYGSGIPGRVEFVERQGREHLYIVRLADGTALRSIQPAEENHALGSQVNWGVSAANILVFDAAGSRL